METWAAAFMLLGNQFKDLGLKGDQGVEAVLAQQLLRRRASRSANWKPIFEQLSYFDKLPENAQRAPPRRRDRTSPTPTTNEFHGMLSAWFAAT